MIIVTVKPFLPYDYPVGKKFIELDENDLDGIESLWGKDIRDQYQRNINHMKFKLRNKKINRILNNKI